MNTIRRFAVVALVPAAVAAALAGCGEKAAPPVKAPAAAPDKAAPAAAPAPDKAKLVAAYDKGLDYLLTQQKEGKWSVKGEPDPSFTAMALSALLERPGGVRASDKPVVHQAVAFVASSFDTDGGIKSPQNRNYMTAAAVMALVAAGRPEDKAVIAKGIDYVKSLQFTDEGDPSYGGIGYGSDKTRSDLSNTQYALASLRAAGVSEDDPVFKNAVKFLERTQNRKENEKPGDPVAKDPASGEVIVRGNDGGAGYRPGDSKAGFVTLPDGKKVAQSYGSMTYALLRCYHLAGVQKDDGRVKAAVDWISKNWKLDGNPGMPAGQEGDGLFYYYATVGKTLPALGVDYLVPADGKKIDWRAELSAHLLSIQAADGSWTNTKDRWLEGMPVLATAYSLTALAPCAR
jgi:squalene-hopene/tetraprenyl-beta-curcumene cyclase